jgi:hypothetical protein
MKFDFVQAAVQSYRFVFGSFRELARLALVPLLIKYVFFVGIILTGLHGEYLRQGLVLLPTYFAEGWFLACAVRLAILKDSYPASLTGDVKHDQAFIAERQFSIKIAVVTYVLIKIVSAAFVGLSMKYYALPEEGAEAATTMSTTQGYYFFAFVALFIFLIWAFRYAWLYVPAAIGMPFKHFLSILKGFNGSFLLLGTWMICFAPVFIVLVLFSDILSIAFPDATLDGGPTIFILLFGAVQSCFELLIAAISSIAVAYGVTQVKERI